MPGHIGRRSVLKLVGGAAAGALSGPVGAPRRSAAQTPNLQSLQTPDSLVLLVPGFLAQVYEAASTFALSGLDSGLRGELKKVPAIGEKLATAIPKLRAPLPDGAAVSFYTQERKLEALGVRYANISRMTGVGFSTQQGVQANGQAIRTVLEGLRARNVKRVVIVSHSKGGLDTLEALLTGETLWRNPVVGWVALQAPFLGSPVAGPDLSGLAVSASHREVVLGLRRALNRAVPVTQALNDLTTEARGPYMSARASAIRRLAGRVQIRSCYTKYQAAPGQTIWTAASAAADFAAGVLTPSFLEDIAKTVATAERQHVGYPERAVEQAVSDSVALLGQRVAAELSRVLQSVGLMDAFNLAMREPNDGLVPVASTQLPGAVVRELLPAADHAAPVMIAAPAHQFWSAGHRDDQTLQLLAEVAVPPPSGLRPQGAGGRALSDGRARLHS